MNEGHYAAISKRGNLIMTRKNYKELVAHARDWIDEHKDAEYDEVTIHEVGKPVAKLERMKPKVTPL